MPMSPRRKQVLIRELRDVTFRVCSGGGALLGLVYALHHWNTQPAACHGGVQELSRCTSHTLGAGVIVFLAPVFVGAIAGMMVGALVASRIRSRQPRAARARRPSRSGGPASLVVRDDQRGEGGHWRWRATRVAVTAAGRRSRRGTGSARRGRNVCERCGIEGSAWPVAFQRLSTVRSAWKRGGSEDKLLGRRPAGRIRRRNRSPSRRRGLAPLETRISPALAAAAARAPM
jgi:hypothetical protein